MGVKRGKTNIRRIVLQTCLNHIGNVVTAKRNA